MDSFFCGFVIVAASLLVGCNAASGPAPSGSASQSAVAGAEAYYQWLTGCLDAIGKDLPQYTRSAEAAAELYVQDGCEIGAYGGDSFVREIYGRSGGMMRMLTFDKPFGRNGAVPNPPKAVVLVGLREDGIGAAAEKVAEWKKKGYYVAVIGRSALRAKVRASGALADAEFDTHAAPEGGLLQGDSRGEGVPPLRPVGVSRAEGVDSGKSQGRDAPGKGPQSRCTGIGDSAEEQDARVPWIVPTESAAASAASWVWMGEFVAACTRLGKMPPMYLGYAVEGAMEREAKYKGVKFHDELPARLESGQLSKQWLGSLRKSLAAMRAGDMPQIRQAAVQAQHARATGHKLWVYLQGHVTLQLMGYPHDPKWFDPIHRDWAALRKDASVGKGDFVLCIGSDQAFAGKDWGNFAENSRKAGAKLAWSFTDYKPDQVKAVGPGEVYVNQHWAKGDAAAVIPHYDIQCLPTSGVIAEAVLWMVHAEMTQ